MKHSLLYIATLAAAATPAAAAAQQLEKDIDVTRDVVVEHYDAQRLALTPQLILPRLTQRPLSYSERTVAIDMPRSITFLEPTAYADTLATSPYNGYATLGYLPIFNMAASAGYRLVDNDRLRLSAWLQYDGSSYKDGHTPVGTALAPSQEHIYRHTVTAGLTSHSMIGRKSEIDAALQYTFSRFNAAGLQDPGALDISSTLYGQSVNRLNASATFFSAVGGLRYSAGASYEYFGYRRGADSWLLGTYPDTEEPWRPVREHVVRLGGLGELPLSRTQSALLGLDLALVDDTRRSLLEASTATPTGYGLESLAGHHCHGIVTLTPAYRLSTDALTLHVGARLQASFHAQKILHIAPAVKVAWRPAPTVTIWGEAGGGEQLNTLSSLYDINYMTAPMMAYADSHLPITVEGGIVAGPWSGAYVELFGGYAVANDWLMPLGFASTAYAPTLFQAIDMRGWHAGLRAGWKYRNWGEASVSAEAAPQRFDRGYYQWRDRAKYVIKAEVTAHPIDRLDVGVGYELRACRALIDRQLVIDGSYVYHTFSRYNLGNVSDLQLRGAYRITPQLSVSLTLENLLGRRVSTLGLVPCEGVHGLAAVSYKF